MLAELSKETSSEGRRELLRKVTEALDPANHTSSESELAEFDHLLAAVAADYSTQVRGQIARLVAGTAAPFSLVAQRFAMDDQIEVARPVLENSTHPDGRHAAESDRAEVAGSHVGRDTARDRQSRDFARAGGKGQ